MLKSKPRPSVKAPRSGLGVSTPIGGLDPDVVKLIEAIARDMAKADHEQELAGAGSDD